jgi:hypothetical protein
MCKVGLESREKTGILESNCLVLLYIENETESVIGTRLKRTTKYYIYY